MYLVFISCMRFKYAVEDERKKKWCDQKNKYETCSLCSQMLMSLPVYKRTLRRRRRKKKYKIICISMTLFVAVTSHVAYIMYKFACINHMNANRVMTWRQKLCFFFIVVVFIYMCVLCCTKRYFQFIFATNSPTHM